MFGEFLEGLALDFRFRFRNRLGNYLVRDLVGLGVVGAAGCGFQRADGCASVACRSVSDAVELVGGDHVVVETSPNPVFENGDEFRRTVGCEADAGGRAEATGDAFVERSE